MASYFMFKSTSSVYYFGFLQDIEPSSTDATPAPPVEFPAEQVYTLPESEVLTLSQLPCDPILQYVRLNFRILRVQPNFSYTCPPDRGHYSTLSSSNAHTQHVTFQRRD
jgi:hypothetical protein